MRGVKREAKRASADPKRRAAAPRAVEAALPAPFGAWFARRGWQPRAHQLALLAKAEDRRSTLLVAPTGAGKTLAGFLPTLVALEKQPRRRSNDTGSGLHTLYISPLKALAEDIARNLVTPVEEMGLSVSIETRSGDTSVARRARQRAARRTSC